jgi:hypothetical protein
MAAGNFFRFEVKAAIGLTITKKWNIFLHGQPASFPNHSAGILT